VLQLVADPVQVRQPNVHGLQVVKPSVAVVVAEPKYLLLQVAQVAPKWPELSTTQEAQFGIATEQARQVWVVEL
jgi:hypothetical protein